MDIYKYIADATFNLTNSIYHLLDIKFNLELESSNKYEISYTSENILNKLSQLLKEYGSIINHIKSQDSKLDFEIQEYSAHITLDYIFVFKDARDRLPEAEYNFRIYDPVHNGILIFLNYLSPNNFIWHYHENQDNTLRFCCKFQNIALKDVLIHYHLVLVIFKALCLIFRHNSDDFDVSETPCDLSKNLDLVLRKVNGMVSFIHLPVKNNLKFGHNGDSCSYADPKYVDINLYNKTNSHYSLYPTPCKLAILGTTIICNSYVLLLKTVPNGQFKCYNLLISTLLLIYNNTCGLILDHIYEVILNLSDNHPEAFSDNSNLLLFKEVVNKMADDINNYNGSVEKCTECFIKLTSRVFNDKDLKIYELLESTVDKLKLMNKKELKCKFMEMYEYYLMKVPLACAATMLQTMELVLGSIDSLDSKSIKIALGCLEKMFTYMPKDAIYYFSDVYGRFIIIYFGAISESKNRDCLEYLLSFEFYKDIIVKVCLCPEEGCKNIDSNRVEVIDSIKNIIKIAKNIIEESVFKNITNKIINEVNGDPNKDDRIVAELNNFCKMFEL